MMQKMKMMMMIIINLRDNKINDINKLDTVLKP